MTLAGIAFAASLGIYLTTLSPGLSYASPDGNELITICATLGLAHSTGYPLYTWLGKLFTFLPIGSVAYRVNLMSAVLGAGGVALLYGIVRLLTEQRMVAVAAAFFFAFSRTFWSQATIAEVYAPNLFWVALTLFFFLLWAEREEGLGGSERASVGTPDRREQGCAGSNPWQQPPLAHPPTPVGLLLGALALGLSLGTHLSNLGFIPAYALFVLLVSPRLFRRPLRLLGAVGLFALGGLQYLWLPYKGTNLTDAMMRNMALNTWQGFYNYTLGAFPQMKFAFALPQIPERIVLYLDLLRQNVGLAGILLGLYGLAEMLWRRTAHFYLLVGMYLVHLFFFVQYRVFDLDVFFIPAHFLYIIAIGYGVVALFSRLQPAVRRVPRHWARVMLAVLGLLVLLGAVIAQATGNYAAVDRSGDTAVEDFYRNVFALLPPGSVLWGQGGVFGHDMFYFRLVEGLRPDVAMPALEGPGRARVWEGRETFTTMVPPGQGRGTPGQGPPGRFAADSWYIPVLLGESSGGASTFPRRELMLYRVSAEPPLLVVEQAHPQGQVNRDLGGLVLVGYDLEAATARAGGTLHITLYWCITGQPRGLVTTALGPAVLESHALGMGNLERYAQEVRQPREGIVVEDYVLVVPSHTPDGPHMLRVGMVLPGALPQSAGAERWVDLEVVEVGS